MAFALAIRNTLTAPRRLMLTSISFVSITTVIFCGSTIQPLLNHFQIATNVDEARESNDISFGREDESRNSHFRYRKRTGSNDETIISPVDDQIASNSNLVQPEAEQLKKEQQLHEKAWLVRKWYNFD